MIRVACSANCSNCAKSVVALSSLYRPNCSKQCPSKTVGLLPPKLRPYYGIDVCIITMMCRLHKKMKATSEVDYPAYGVTGPSLPANGKDSRTGGSPGDRKLAQSAQMYHYQHQKQQMIASERYKLHQSNSIYIRLQDERQKNRTGCHEAPSFTVPVTIYVRMHRKPAQMIIGR